MKIPDLIDNNDRVARYQRVNSPTFIRKLLIRIWPLEVLYLTNS